MFATLAGGYSRQPHRDRPDRLAAARISLAQGEIEPAAYRSLEDELVREAIGEQDAAGLELITDGQLRWPDPVGTFPYGLDRVVEQGPGRLAVTGEPQWVAPVTLDDWRFLRAATDLPARQTLVGPYTLARLIDPGPLSRERLTMTLADAMGRELRALADAGCDVIQIEERAAAGISTEAERSLYRAAQRRMTHGLQGVHLMLAITEGSAHRATARVIFDARYRSYLFDLVAGANNWLLIAEAPTDRGIICGVADATNPEPDDPARMAWAGRYAALVRKRGPDRVGLAPSASLAFLPREAAYAKIERLSTVALDLFEAGVANPDPMTPEAIEALVMDGLVHGYFGKVTVSDVEEARRRELEPADQGDGNAPADIRVPGDEATPT